MKVSRLLALTLLIAAAFAIFVNAQDAEAPVIKVMFINTDAFEGKDGITKYVRALDLAFGEPDLELNAMRVKLAALAKEVKVTPVGGESAAIAEYQRLEIQIRRREEDRDAAFMRRRNEVVTPVLEDINRALQEFAKQRGYSVILDAAKLKEAVVAYDAAKADVTKEFIAFYNARTVTTAAKPR